MNFELSTERRKHKRYRLKQGTYAGSSPSVGMIVDISLGGVAFNYVKFGDQEAESNFVLCGDDDCCIENLPCQVISDKASHGSSSLSPIVTRRRRVSFGNLTEAQTLMLEKFIYENQQCD